MVIDNNEPTAKVVYNNVEANKVYVGDKLIF